MQINWLNILVNSGAKIEYVNHNWHGETPRTDADIALLSFPRQIHVELQWNRTKKAYFATLYDNDFELLRRVSATTASDALDHVKSLANLASQIAKGEQIPLSAAEESIRINWTAACASPQSIKLQAGSR